MLLQQLNLQAYIDFHIKLASYYTHNIDKNIVLKKDNTDNIDDIDLDEIYKYINDGKNFIKGIKNSLLLNNYK